MNIIVLDVEIKKAIQSHGEPKLEGIVYCDGWRDFANMGVACVCTFETETHLTRVFLEEDRRELAEYLDGKTTAGFNTKRFDIPLLVENGVGTANGGFSGSHYDILEQIWLAQGLNPDKFVPATHGGWSLDSVAGATLGEKKSGHGALAPVWWQQGKRGKVIDYCCRDSWLEAKLLEHIIRTGWVKNERGACVTLRGP